MRAQDLIDQIAPPDTRSIADRKSTAFHEAGHAFVAARLGFDVEQISLLVNDAAGGLTTVQFPPSAKTWHDIENMVATLMAGRAADCLFGGGADSGASADLAMATTLLAKAIGQWGLGNTLIVSALQTGQHPLAGNLAGKIDSALQAGLRRASAMLAADVETVTVLAERLVTQRVLSRSEILSIVGSPRHPADLLPADRISPLCKLRTSAPISSPITLFDTE